VTGVTAVMSLLMIGLGVAMIAVTLANGGGPVAFGLVIGVLFVAAGGGRLWVSRRR
jgi:Zn-dependent protease with chaperone function